MSKSGAVNKYTHCRDYNKEKIFYGDELVGCYGIPPVVVRTKAEKLNGKPIVRTPGHNPEMLSLRSAVRYLDLTLERSGR